MAIKFLNSVNADSGVLYVDAANDRVGIGTTSPADKLQVQGNLAVPSGVIYNGAAANSAGLGLNNAYFDASGYYGIRFFSSLATVGSQTERMRITNTGNVGIGTTAPNALLSISKTISSDTRFLEINNAGNNQFRSDIDFTVTSGGITVGRISSIYPAGNNVGLSFSTYGTSPSTGLHERMRINGSNGNVGIGTTSPIDKLHVEGVIQSKKQLLPSTSSTAGWYKIGTLEDFVQGGSTAVIEIAGHQGYNATNSQDYLIKLFIKTSNGNAGGPNGQGFNSWYERTGGNSATIEFKWDNSATNDYDLYMYIPTHSLRSWYSVKKGTGTWEHAGTSATDPGANSASVLKATSLFNILDANVGIGTTTPGAKLDVNGEIFASSNVQISATGAVGKYYIRRPSDGSASAFFGYNSADNTDFGIYNGSGGGNVKFWSNNGIFQFNNTASSELMRITSAGNVGIGTTSPGAKLDINTDQTSQIPIRVTHNNYNDWLIQKRRSDDTQKLGIKEVNSNGGMGFATADAVRMIIDSSGNVGIGTTSPGAKLDVEGGNIRITYNSGYNLELSDSGGSGTINANGDSAQLRFGTTAPLDSTATERMRIDASGNVGIGTTSPAYKLDVNGNVGITGDLEFTKVDGIHIKAKESMIFTIDSDNNDTGRVFQFKDGGGDTLMRIGDDGNVGIGTTSPSAKLHVKSSGNGAYILRGMSSAGTDLGGLYQSTAGDGEIYLKTSAVTTNVRISSNNVSYLNGGNVGIGTTSPSAKLDVIGVGRILMPDDPLTGAVTAKILSYSTAPYGMVFRSYSSGANSIQVQRESSDSETFALSLQPNGGNVGIGTTTPDAPLTVHSSTDPEIRFGYSSTQDHRIQWDSSKVYIHADPENANASSALGLYVDGTSRLYIPDSGNVGIGTTSPQSPLTVKSSSFSAANSGFTLIANGSTDIIAAIGEKSTNGGRFHLYDGGVEKVAFYSDGTNNHISAGNVGIGTTSPTGILDVKGASGTVYDTQLKIVASEETGAADTGGSLSFVGHDGSVARTHGAVRGRKENSTVGNYGGYLAFDTRANNATLSEKMRILGNGNVGIGTSSPGQKLVVAGGTNGRVRIKVDEGTNNYGKFEFSTSDSGTGSGEMLAEITATITDSDPNSLKADLSFSTNSGDSLATAMTIRADRFVRIGNTAASNAYTPAQGYVAGLSSPVNGGQTYLSITTGAGSLGDTGVVFGVDSNGGSWYHREDKPLRLYTQNLERMRVTGSGNVGIGNTNPQYKLDVAGAAEFQDYIRITNTGGSQKILLGNQDSAGVNNPSVIVAANGNTYIGGGDSWSAGGGTLDYTATFTDGGYVGIGTTSPSSKLHINDGSLQFDKTNTSGGGDFDFIKMGYNGSWSQNQGGIAGISVDDATGVVGRYGITYGAGGGRFVVTDLYDGSYAQSGDVFYVRGDGDAYIQGSLGIGATSPSSKLTVVGSGAIGALRTTSSQGLNWLSFQDTDGTERGYVGYGASSNNNLYLAQLKSADLYLYNNGTRLTVKQDGNVGIGTTNPDHKLTVYTDATSGLELVGQDGGNQNSDSSKIIFNGYTQDNGPFIQAINTSAYGIKRLGFFVNRTASDYTTLPTESVSITNTGNVGIGTTSPYSNVTLQYTGNNSAGTYYGNLVLNATTDSTWNRLRFDRGGVARFGVALSYQDKFVISNLYTNGTTADPDDTAFVILQNSNVGIGTASPTEKLHVSGDVRIEGDLTVNGSYTQIDTDVNTTEQWNVTNDGTGPAVTINQTGAQDIMDVQDDGTSVFYIEDGGNVGIGDTAPDAKLHVQTDGGATTAPNTVLIIQANTATTTLAGGGTSLLFRGVSSGGNIQNYEQARIRSVGYATNNAHGFAIDVKPDASTSLTEALFLGSNGQLKLPYYGAGYLKTDANGNVSVDSDTIEDTLDSVTDRGNTTTNDIEVGNITTKNDSGIYSFSDTVNASASEDIFSISNNHGAQAFRVTFVCNTSAYSVAKTFEVVHSDGNAPVFFKVVDTGAYGTHDFDVSFTNDATDDSKVVCSITNNSTTINADIVTTVFLGGSPTAITVTAL